MDQVIEAGWRNAFEVMKTNYSLTDDAIGVFAINLRFNLDDIQTIVSEAITGGGDDKKCDVLYVDKEREIAVIAQCYISQRSGRLRQRIRPPILTLPSLGYCPRIWTIFPMCSRGVPTSCAAPSMPARLSSSTSGTFTTCLALKTSKMNFAQSRTLQGLR
jgi:hypothetical protein